jgi:glycine/D-amino acid oxidase-like deaminating enzyme
MQQSSIAVVGAGVIGTSIACALARAGHGVTLIDRRDPGEGGASFGNAGHIATELLEPLPAPALLYGFWRMLTTFGGPLDIPLRRLPAFAPWAARFVAAAFRRAPNTLALARFVRPAVGALEAVLRDIGRSDLMKLNGHHEIWLDGRAAESARAQARLMEKLEVPTQPAPAELLQAAQRAAGAVGAAGLWFPKCAHVLDPLELVRAFAAAARARGATVVRREVKRLTLRGARVEISTDADTIFADSALVCAGAWSAPLLRPFGLTVPLEAARGYHVELPGVASLIDAPLLYANHNLLLTPMTGRLRASGFMEFAGLAAPPDPRKPAALRDTLGKLGYAAHRSETSWMGARPVLPDYLPAIGRVAGTPNLGYAFGHQHIGLTLCAVTADVVADMVAGRPPRIDIAAFDLRRFG